MLPTSITKFLFDINPELDFINYWDNFINDFESYQKLGVWNKMAVTKNIGTAKIVNSIIHDEAVIGDFALIRNSIISKGVLIGAHCQINKSIILEESKFPHFNNVGYSLIGRNVLFGASSVTTSVRLDNSYPFIKFSSKKTVKSKSLKYGALVGDNVKVGSLVVINPFTIIQKDLMIKPLENLKGIIKEGSEQCAKRR